MINGWRRMAVILIVAGLGGCAGVALSSEDLGKTQETALGTVLVGSHGETLYVYDRDSTGLSSCTGACAVAWPPAKADAAAMPAKGFTVIARGNGGLQWAYHGRPLYGYAFDKGPGATSGDGAEAVWHVAKP